MDTYLVVRTLDVNYAPLPVARVLAAIDGGPAQPLTKTKQPGVSELRLPPGATRIEVSVTERGFWPITQKLTLSSGALPSLAWDGPQSVNARDLEAHSRGSDANAVVNLVLGHLQDARAKVDAIFNQGGIFSISPTAHHIRDLDRALLNPSGRGWDRLKHTVSSNQTPDGKLFFVERLTSPRLVAIYQPSRRFVMFQRDGGNPTYSPIPYHVFFHPSTSHFKAQKEYPFHTSYVDLMSRYMLYEQTFNIGKAMVNQHHVSGKRPVFIFPIGSPIESFGSIPLQSNLLRLLQEINYWLQRMDGIAYPRHPVGFCAVSGYSAGCEALRATLSSSHAAFDENHLREVYGFDLFTPSDIAGMCTSLARWFRKGAGGRKLRIYTQNHEWLTKMRGLLSSGAGTNGPSNAFEDETDASTLLFDSVRTFWTDMSGEATPRAQYGRLDNVPGTVTTEELEEVKSGALTQAELDRRKYYEVHDIHPALYMTHALKLSSFAD